MVAVPIDRDKRGMGFCQAGAEEMSMKNVVKLIVAVAAVAGLGGSSAVAQGGAQRQVTYFYDDESETNVVGGLLIYCNGSRVRWGEFTVYSETTEYTCP
jgi:hypothetical protein